MTTHPAVTDSCEVTEAKRQEGGHMCGMQGFNGMTDECPACEANRAAARGVQVLAANQPVQCAFCEQPMLAGGECLTADRAATCDMRARGVGVGVPAWSPEPPCWLVEKRQDGRTVGFLGHANGSYEWMPTADKATRFVRREDANGMAECIETADVIVAEHIWG
jgi:hypothetical protein